MCTVVFLKESNTSLWRGWTKLKSQNKSKQTELAKRKHDVNTMHTNRCVTFDMSFDTPQSNSSALLKKKKKITRWHFQPIGSAARILIVNLRHRQALLLTRSAVLLGEGRPDTRQRRKSSLHFQEITGKGAASKSETRKAFITREFIQRVTLWM